MEKYMMPRRVVQAVKTENTKWLFEPRVSQLTLLSAEDIDKEYLKIEKSGYILIDFGIELCGGIELSVRTVGAESGLAKCRIVFGESVTEALSTIGEKNATNDHAIRDMTVEVPAMSCLRYGDTGFRFVKIEAVDADIYIKTVRAVNDAENWEYKGNFECSDTLLNTIWKTGAYTVELNTHDYIWDGAKRDRLVWIGDMHPEVSAINAVFGNHPAIKSSLDYIKQGTPSTEWMNRTATYSMWWIIIHYDYFMHWGDFEYLAAQEPYLIPLCNHIIEWAEEDFAAPQNVMTGFVDWSSKHTENEMEGRKAITCIALDCAKKLFEYLENLGYASKCEKCLNQIRMEKADRKNSKSISALTVLSGRDDSLAREVLAGNSPEDMSCFMGYYVLKAKAMLGDYQDSLDIIKKYWGAMLDAGATTFWEDFDMAWVENSARIDEVTPEGMNSIHGDFGKHCYEGLRLSLCHGWASGPTPYLMEQIGGIEILEPGCKKVKISPNIAALDWIKVKYPTPYGDIIVYAENTINGIVTKIDAPEAIEIVR